MGFWDKEINGPLDDMFDLDGNGMLSPGEQAFKYDFLNSYTNNNNTDNYDEFDNDYDDIDIDF